MACLFSRSNVWVWHALELKLVSDFDTTGESCFKTEENECQIAKHRVNCRLHWPEFLQILGETNIFCAKLGQILDYQISDPLEMKGLTPKELILKTLNKGDIRTSNTFYFFNVKFNILIKKENHIITLNYKAP